MAFLAGSAWAAAGQEPSAGPEPGRGEHAAESAPDDDPPTVAAPPVSLPARGEKEAPTEVDVGLATRLAVGAGFSHPLGLTGRVQLLHGLSADVREDEGRVRAVCAVPIAHCAEGFLLEAEAGSGGGKLSLGLGARARVEGEDFHGTVGVALRASLARTWGSPYGTPPGLTYLGTELDLAVVHLRLSLGVMRRISGGAGPSWLFAWGVGVGL